jgi:hypothetical protein
MSYAVKWGREPRRLIHGVEELDDVIDSLATARGDAQAPYVLSVFLPTPDEDDDYAGVQIAVGAPERSFVFYNGPGGGYGFDPALEEWAEDIVFDLGGQATEYHPAETRVTPAAALAAARQFVGTGRRPTGLQWLDA